MIRHASALPLAVFLSSCATTTNPYLSKIGIALPREGYSAVSDKLEAGREIPTADDYPIPNDFPPSRKIVMNDPTKPFNPFPPYVVRFYDLKGLKEDRRIQNSVRSLRTIVHSPLLPTSSPRYPPVNAGHLFQKKLSCHHFPWGSGVFRLVQYTQGPGNFPNNEELAYEFQGLGKDGRLYVSAEFRVTHPILPASIQAVPDSETLDEDADKMAARLDQQSDDSFSPGLSIIRLWIESIRLPASE